MIMVFSILISRTSSPLLKEKKNLFSWIAWAEETIRWCLMDARIPGIVSYVWILIWYNMIRFNTACHEVSFCCACFVIKMLFLFTHVCSCNVNYGCTQMCHNFFQLDNISVTPDISRMHSFQAGKYFVWYRNIFLILLSD